jgi:hypothetical protein
MRLINGYLSGAGLQPGLQAFVRLTQFLIFIGMPPLFYELWKKRTALGKRD